MHELFSMNTSHVHFLINKLKWQREIYIKKMKKNMTVSRNRKRKIVFFFQIYESENEESIKTNDPYLRTTYSHFCKEKKGIHILF